MSQTASQKTKQGRRSTLPSAVRYEEGLCSTCSAAAECVLAMKSKEPVQFCEEFDSGPSDAVPTSQSTETQPWETTGVEYPQEKRFAGLCANCGELGKCVYSRPDDLILHCEHYS